MTQSLAHALGFGCSWLALSLFVAAMPFFGRSKHQRVRGLPLNSEQKAIRRSIVVAGVVSALCGTIAARLHGDGSTFNQTMLLALLVAALTAAVLLATYAIGWHNKMFPPGPPVTGYRVRVPDDAVATLVPEQRDGPHT